MNYASHLAEWHETPARFTADEFMEIVQRPPFTQWVGKTELVDGVIVRMSPAHVPHWNAQRIVSNLVREAYADQAHKFIVGVEPTVRLDETTVREPDVAVLKYDSLVDDVFASSALVLAIEIADSSLAIDLRDKMRDYANAGIATYWVVDINGRQIHVMTNPGDGEYRNRSLIAFGEVLTLPGTDATITID